MTAPPPPWPPGRLRAQPVPRPFEIVLVEPEIPPNTGNVARLCAATGCALHLVGPLGFSIDERAVRRAGLDYWHLVTLAEHANLGAAQRELSCLGVHPGPARSWYFSGKARTSFFEVEVRLGDVLVFGKESVGLPPELLDAQAEQVVGLPTLGGVRSLNLSNSVAVALYEALRQVGALAGARNGDPSALEELAE